MIELHESGRKDEDEEICCSSVIATSSAVLMMLCRELVESVGNVHSVTRRESLDAAISDIPSLMTIVDINLPGLSGVEGIETLLRNNPGLKMLVITEVNNDETSMSLLRAGVSGYCQAAELKKSLTKAAIVIHSGEIWAERRIISRLLSELRAGNRTKMPEMTLGDRLTPREQEVTKLVSEGLRQKNIADYLDISENTVRNHLRNIFDKTGVSSRLQLALLVKGG